MSECRPGCECGQNPLPPKPEPKTLRRDACGLKRDYKTDSDGVMDVLICDRRKGHNGAHRARSGYGEKLFWKTGRESRRE